MPNSSASQVQKQVSKASKRLCILALLGTVAYCWAGAILVATLWFLAQPWLLGEQEESVRWSIAGGIFAVACGLGVWLAWRRSPGRVEAALELDLRFKL